MFRHSIVAVAFTLIVVACARAQGPQSPDGRYRAESARSGESVHCRVIEEATGRVVLTTHAQFPSKNDVKSNDLQSCGAFSSDSTRIAAIYHYGHRGSYTWIGVFSLATGKLVREREISGWTRYVPDDVFGDSEPPAPSPKTRRLDPAGSDAPIATSRTGTTSNGTSSTATPFRKGVAYTSWRPGEYTSVASDTTLSGVVKPMGVDWISLLVTCYQQTVTSTEIACKPDASTPTDDDLVHVVGVAHRLGIRVMLKPHIDLSGDPGHWRGQIQFGEDEQAWRAWFGAYASVIGHYAALAERTGVDLFAVGTELEGTSHRANDWRTVVAAVRRVYSGPVTYASNWTEIGRVSWWDALDLIGIDAYYPLTDKDQPSPADLRAAWSSIVSDLDTLSRKWGRRILFTEIGYRSVNGANREPYNFQRSGVVDLQEQADCYQAALEFMTEQEWFDGFFWWNWTPNPDQGGTLDADYTANGKPAADVLRAFYTRP